MDDTPQLFPPDGPALSDAGALLRATLAQVAPQLLRTDNVGASDDARDVYYWLDYLCFAVERAYPSVPCNKGCSHCCRVQVFRVSAVEWARVRAGIAHWPDERRAALWAEIRAAYGPHRAELEAIADAWTNGLRAPEAALAGLPKDCPMLDASGRCGVYAERPAICRGYGYFSATIAGEASLLICQQEGPGWIRALETAGVEQLPMPSWNPVQRQIEAINRASEGAEGALVRPLPLWLLEEAETTASA